MMVSHSYSLLMRFPEEFGTQVLKMISEDPPDIPNPYCWYLW